MIYTVLASNEFFHNLAKIMLLVLIDLLVKETTNINDRQNVTSKSIFVQHEGALCEHFWTFTNNCLNACQDIDISDMGSCTECCYIPLDQFHWSDWTKDIYKAQIV